MTVDVRDMTREDEALVGTCARAQRTPEVDSCASRRLAWLREMAPRGVRAKVALRDGRPAGFAYAVPIEVSPWGPLGAGILVMPCIYVAEDEGHHGVGQALVSAVEEEALDQQRHGVATMACNHEAWFMPRAFFEGLGYRVADRHGVEVLLFKALSPGAERPRLLNATYEFEPCPGKVVVDLFWNRFCLTSELEARRVREVVRDLGEDVHLREYDAGDPRVLGRHQIPRAIFVDGDRVTWGYEAPREGLRDAIDAARARH